LPQYNGDGEEWGLPPQPTRGPEGASLAPYSGIRGGAPEENELGALYGAVRKQLVAIILSIPHNLNPLSFAAGVYTHSL